MAQPSVEGPANFNRHRDIALGWALLRAKLKIRRNGFRIAVTHHPGRTALAMFTLIPLLFVVGLMLLIAIGGGMSNAAGQDATTILGLMLTVTAVAAFIGSSTTALQSLYLSNDLNFLMTLPMPLRVLYGSKLVEAATGTLPAAFLGLMSLIAYGVTTADHLRFIPVAIAAELMVIALTTSLSVVVVASITRSIPAKRARLFLIAVSLAVIGTTLAIWSAIAPTGLAKGQGGDTAALSGIEGILAWLPTGWIAMAIAGADQAAWSRFAEYASLATAATLLAIVVSYQVFARSFSTSVALTRSVLAARPNRTLGIRLTRLVRVLPRGMQSLLVKEWLTLLRDLRRLSGVIWPLGVVAISGLSAHRQQPAETGDGYRYWLTNASLALVPWAVSLGITIYSFGSEGRNIHLLRQLPISPRRLFFTKALAGFVPVIVVSEAVVWVVSVSTGAQVTQALAMSLVVAWTAFGFVTIDTAASAYAPNFEANHIQRSTELIGRMFGIAAGTLFGSASALAIGRLVLFATETPAEFDSFLTWRIGGVSPFGWPVVFIGFGLAAGILIVVTKFAIGRVTDLIRTGV